MGGELKFLHNLTTEEDHTASLHRIISRYIPNARLQKYTYLGRVDFDAEAWRLLINDEEYLLYAEDYLPDITLARKNIKDNTGISEGEYVELLKHPDKSNDLSKYASDSGYYTILLLKLGEKNVRN